LKERYGEPRLIRRALHTELRKVPLFSPRIQDLRSTLESIDEICRQLATLGEDVDNPGLIMQILERFPSNIIFELSKMKDLTEDWHFDSLHKTLHYIISVKKKLLILRRSLA